MNLMNIAMGNISGFTGSDIMYFSFTSDLFDETATYTLLDQYKSSIPFENVNLPKDTIIRLRDYCNRVLEALDDNKDA
jgi:hypothetical protein